MQPYLKRVQAACRALQQGEMIILTDHPDRENEGDLIVPAETVTTEQMNFIIKNTSGIVCLSLPAPHVKQLGLNLLVPPHENTSRRGTPFTIPIDARNGISTGVSAADRVQTIRVAMDLATKPDDLVKPGHVFPLQAKASGVLERAGHTEGAVDIVRIAGFKPAAVLCEIMNPDGTMMHGAALTDFAKKHNLCTLAIEDIILYRQATENLIAERVEARLPIADLGDFKITVIKETLTGHEHVVLEKMYDATKPVFVRIHSACMTGDIFGSLRCDCRKQFDYALQQISKHGGILIYLNQEGRGIGLLNKIKAYALQEQGLDTIEANEKLGLPIDAREYYIAANILREWHVSNIRLLTNNPAKVSDLKKYGVAEVTMEAMPVFCNEYNKHYLKTKEGKLNHQMDFGLE